VFFHPVYALFPILEIAFSIIAIKKKNTLISYFNNYHVYVASVVYCAVMSTTVKVFR